MPRILSRTPSMVQAQQRQRRRKSTASYPSAPSLRRVGLQQQKEAQSPKIAPHQRNETKFFSTASLSVSDLRHCENSRPERYSQSSSDSIQASQPSLVESLVSSRSSSCATFLGNSPQSSSVSGQIVNNPRKAFKKQSSMPNNLPSSTSSSSECSSWGLFVDVEEKHADLERRLSTSLPTKIRS